MSGECVPFTYNHGRIICNICGEMFSSPVVAGGHARMHSLAEVPALQEMRALLAEAAVLLKDKLTPNEGQLRTQWDRDVDEWLMAATPLFEDE